MHDTVAARLSGHRPATSRGARERRVPDMIRYREAEGCRPPYGSHTAVFAILRAVDQRTDDQPIALSPALNAAGLNPAHIPGLTPAPAPAPEDAVTDGTAADDAVEDATVEDAAGEGAAVGAAPAPDADTDDPAPERPAADAADDGPVFSVSDRRGGITADRSGIRLRLDGEEAEFGWEELSAVEYATSRWTRRFTITVHLPRPRWFRNDVQAEDRAHLEQWSEQLEEVLNAYFEE